MSKPLFSADDDDIEFKRFIWSSILYIVKENGAANQDAKIIVQEKDFISAILVYLDDKNPINMRYQPSQLTTI